MVTIKSNYLFPRILHYVLAFSLFLFNAAWLTRRSAGIVQSGRGSPMYVSVAMIIGLACCLFVTPVLVKQTTSRLEQLCILLSSLLCILLLAESPRMFTHVWPILPFASSLFLVISYFAAALVGVRLIQVVHSPPPR
jgi:hypothetical protein